MQKSFVLFLFFSLSEELLKCSQAITLNLLTLLCALFFAGISASSILLCLPPGYAAVAGSRGLNGHLARAAVLTYALSYSLHLRHSLHKTTYFGMLWW